MTDAYGKAVASAKDHPAASAAVATLGLGFAWIVSDFLEWKAFGTGGTPPNVRGYIRMTILRLKFFFHNVFEPGSLRKDDPSYIKGALPPRAGGRPQLMPRILPQRQKPEKVDPAVEEKLQNMMKSLAEQHPQLFAVRLSHTEGKTTDGLYALENITTLNPVAKDKLLNHEIAHAHPSDNSLHVWLSDADVLKVMEAGWGCRFCLPFVRSGWTMVYAPRTEDELQVVERIVKAACGWITGVEI